MQTDSNLADYLAHFPRSARGAAAAPGGSERRSPQGWDTSDEHEIELRRWRTH